MALLTFAGSVAKGTAKSMSLSKSAIAAMASVSGDAYWSDAANISKAIVVYGADGGQEKFLTFNFEQSSPSASLLISAKGRNAWTIKRLILIDYDGGELVLERAVLQAEVAGGIAGLDLSLGGGVGALPVLSGLYAHFKADSLALSDGAEVTTWTSEVGSYAFSATSTYKPTYIASSALNGKPVVRNVSGYKYMDMNGALPNVADFSTFIVGKATSTSQDADALIIGSIGSSGPRYNLNYGWAYRQMSGLVLYQLDNMFGGQVNLGFNSTDPFIVGHTLDHGIQSQTYLNGVKKSTYNGAGIGSGENGNLRILGKPGSNQFRGDIAEIIIYDRVLTDSEVSSVQSYLATKYGITI